MIKNKWNFTRYAIIGIIAMLVVSCKSTKMATDESADSRLSSKLVIKTHYQNTTSFKTLSGKVKINYSNGETSQNFTVSLRMEKDKGIWISAPLGIVKAYVTPTRVSFYNRLKSEYFDGDFSYLSKLLGTEVDYEMLQNLLLGQAIVDLRSQKYNISIADNSYELKPKEEEVLYKTLFQIEPKNYKIAMQQVSQPLKKQSLEIRYENYQQIEKDMVPNEIKIVALEENHRNTIALEYRSLELDRAINFPYKIPKGLKEVVLE